MKILSNKKYNELILKPLQGCFAQVDDDMLLRENGLLYAENKQLHSIIKEALEYIEEHKQKGYRTPMSDDYEFWNELDENEIKELLEILEKENI